MPIVESALQLREVWTVYHAWFVGFLLVAVISYTRFNTPPTSRPSTTWGRYHTFAAIYMIMSLVLWIVLANTPAAVAWLSQELAKNLKLDGDVTRELTAPLYAALALTVSIPAIKPLKSIDAQLRSFLQVSARIPWEARRLSASLQARTWLPQSKLQQDVENELKAARFGPEAISFLDDGSEAALWTKLTCLHRHLSRWKGVSGFVSIRAQRTRLAAFYAQYEAEFEQVRTDYAALEGAARRLFALLDELQPSGAAAAVATARPDQGPDALDGDLRARIRRELTEGFIRRAKLLEQTICDLVSRALLKCGLTEGGRRSELGAMGFVVNVAPSHLFDHVLVLYAGLATLYVSMLAYNGRPSFVVTGVAIATIYLGSIVAGLYPKRWPWAQASEGGIPARGYALSAAIAFGFSLAASFGLSVLGTLKLDAALRVVRDQSWPWAFIGATTAVLLAYLVDRPRTWPRGAETLVQASGTALAAAGVWVIRRRICEGSTAPDCVPPLIGVVGTAALAGALIGAMVPTLYREPERLTSRYKDWTIQVAAIRGVGGQFGGDVTLTPPSRSPGNPEGSQKLLFDDVFESSDEALAQAVHHARAWIEKQPADGGSSRS
jgi:hypothetical protein